MSTWLAIPSARPDGGTIPLWRERGYKVAVFVDPGEESHFPTEFTMSPSRSEGYPGYAISVNRLVKWILREDPQTEWIVTGGDDVEPDKNHTPEEIAAQCSKHFRFAHGPYMRPGSETIETEWPATFGVMQPTGGGHGIETICGSPWMGRSFCERINGGNGPLWHEYTHNFVDNELQEVANRLGVLWQRPDLTHQHNNWMWTTGVRPKFLDEAYSQAHWQKYKALFQSRQRAGFPGHAPLIDTPSSDVLPTAQLCGS